MIPGNTIAGTAHTQTTQTHPIPGAPVVMIKLSGEREQAQTSTALAKQKDLRGGDGGGEERKGPGTKLMAHNAACIVTK